MIAMLARPLAVVAAIGWGLSLVVSILAIAGVDIPQTVTTGVFVGVFPLWFCAVLMSGRLVRNVQNADFWKAALRGCPTWLRYAIWGSWGYAFLMFAMGFLGPLEDASAGFVGVFYASALGIFITSASATDEPTQCANGHPIGPFDQFCRECGVSINRAADSDVGRSKARRVLP